MATQIELLNVRKESTLDRAGSLERAGEYKAAASLFLEAARFHYFNKRDYDRAIACLWGSYNCYVKEIDCAKGRNNALPAKIVANIAYVYVKSGDYKKAAKYAEMARKESLIAKAPAREKGKEWACNFWFLRGEGTGLLADLAGDENGERGFRMLFASQGKARKLFLDASLKLQKMLGLEMEYLKSLNKDRT